MDSRNPTEPTRGRTCTSGWRLARAIAGLERDECLARLPPQRNRHMGDVETAPARQAVERSRRRRPSAGGPGILVVAPHRDRTSLDPRLLRPALRTVASAEQSTLAMSSLISIKVPRSAPD
jgi:hypothetical protein